MKINFEKLKKIAESSENGEAYITVAKSNGWRIGVGIRTGHQKPYFVELLLPLCPEFGEVSTTAIEKKLLILRNLESRGYLLSCESDSYVSCELCVALEELEKEVEELRKMVSSDRWDIVV